MNIRSVKVPTEAFPEMSRILRGVFGLIFLAGFWVQVLDGDEGLALSM